MKTRESLQSSDSSSESDNGRKRKTDKTTKICEGDASEAVRQNPSGDDEGGEDDPTHQLGEVTQTGDDRGENDSCATPGTENRTQRQNQGTQQQQGQPPQGPRGYPPPASPARSRRTTTATGQERQGFAGNNKNCFTDHHRPLARVEIFCERRTKVLSPVMEVNVRD